MRHVILSMVCLLITIGCTENEPNRDLATVIEAAPDVNELSYHQSPLADQRHRGKDLTAQQKEELMHSWVKLHNGIENALSGTQGWDITVEDFQKVIDDCKDEPYVWDVRSLGSFLLLKYRFLDTDINKSDSEFIKHHLDVLLNHNYPDIVFVFNMLRKVKMYASTEEITSFSERAVINAELWLEDMQTKTLTQPKSVEGSTRIGMNEQTVKLIQEYTTKTRSVLL